MYGKHISAALTGTLPQSAPWDQYSSGNDPEERKTQFTAKKLVIHDGISQTFTTVRITHLQYKTYFKKVSPNHSKYGYNEKIINKDAANWFHRGKQASNHSLQKNEVIDLLLGMNAQYNIPNMVSWLALTILFLLIQLEIHHFTAAQLCNLYII